MWLERALLMRFRNLILTVAVAAALAGCTNETLDSVNLSSVKNKTEYQLSGKMVSKMRELGMQKTSRSCCAFSRKKVRWKSGKRTRPTASSF